jgi:hypothetical protein
MSEFLDVRAAEVRTAATVTVGHAAAVRPESPVEIFFDPMARETEGNRARSAWPRRAVAHLHRPREKLTNKYLIPAADPKFDSRLIVAERAGNVRKVPGCSNRANRWYQDRQARRYCYRSVAAGSKPAVNLPDYLGFTTAPPSRVCPLSSVGACRSFPLRANPDACPRRCRSSILLNSLH